jgi:hypothetical protein
MAVSRAPDAAILAGELPVVLHDAVRTTSWGAIYGSASSTRRRAAPSSAIRVDCQRSFDKSEDRPELCFPSDGLNGRSSIFMDFFDFVDGDENRGGLHS